MILGIDEAGRGPWAGPMTVGAVVLGDAHVEGLNDSKQLTKKRRELLEPEILGKAVAAGIGWVSAGEIDSLGLAAALRLATVRAVKQIDAAGVAYSEIIIDGTVNFLAETSKGRFVRTMPKADGIVPAVSAASIIAKVARDRFMTEQDVQYPEYGFSSHAGYGTAKHRAAIEQFGVTPLHRLSFGPLKKYAVAGGVVSEESADRSEGSERDDLALRGVAKQRGDAAEALVAEHLETLGHTIIARNWKNRFCEIDIISHAHGTLYFTEVKYRRSVQHGDGVAAVTPRKRAQMSFAAELYQAQNSTLHESAALLAVASVGGDDMTIESWAALTEE